MEDPMLDDPIEDDTIPASPDHFLAAVRMNDEGDMIPEVDDHPSEGAGPEAAREGGQDAQLLDDFGDEFERELLAEGAKSPGDGAGPNVLEAFEALDGTISSSAVKGAGAVPVLGEDEDEDLAIEGGEPEATTEEALPEEPWMSLPESERELWERMRPRALRREAAQVRAQRIPTAVMNRLMKLHPQMPPRSMDVLEIINCATVLMAQALVRATVRRKGGDRTRVQMSDVREACTGVKELEFLCPLESTLDATCLTMRAEPAGGLMMDGDGDFGSGRGGTTGSRVPPKAPGQRALVFRHSAPPEPSAAPVTVPEPAPPPRAQDGAQQSPQAARAEPKPGGGAKRKAPPAKAAANKAGKAAKTAQTVPLPISSFFRRAE